MGQREFRSPLVHILCPSGGPQGFTNMMRYRFPPQWPFNSSSGTYQSPLEWMFTAGRDVWDLMQVLKKSV